MKEKDGSLVNRRPFLVGEGLYFTRKVALMVQRVVLP